jgi:subtilisin family serine protease
VDPLLAELLDEGVPEDEIEALIRLRDGRTAPEGVRLVAGFGQVATCRLLRGNVAAVWQDPGVISLKAGRLLEAGDLPEEGVPVDEIGPSDERRPSDLAVTGAGVVVGVVDWGLDFAHPNFRNDDGTTRLLALWDQGAPMAPETPNAYGYGRIHSAPALDDALRAADPYAALGYHPARSDPRHKGAHGTHVADIAVGNGRVGPSGVAPGAALVFVQLATRSGPDAPRLGDSVTLLEAIDFIERVAGDRPLVINLSMGRHGGPHTGDTLVEMALDAAITRRPGTAIVLSCGNYFEDAVHTAGRLSTGERHAVAWRVDPADVTPNELEVWYPGVDVFSVSLAAPGGEPVVTAAPGMRRSILVDGAEVARLYHRAHDPNNGDNHVDVFLRPGAPAGAWQLTLAGDSVVDGRYHCWVERDAGCPHCQSHFARDRAVATTTTGTICNGHHTIAVGAYDAHLAEPLLAGFSSSGPTRDGRQKPDLIAPGFRVLAARSAPGLPWERGELLTRKTGTSMASPHVTGTIALLFEASGRRLSPDETRALLLDSTTALPDAPPARVGRGMLDTARAVAALTMTRTTTPRDEERSPPMSDEADDNQVREDTERQEALEAFTALPDEPDVEVGSAVDRAVGSGMIRSPGDLLAAIVGERDGRWAGRSPAALFDRYSGPLAAGGPFAVVARPGNPLGPGMIQRGDVLLRRATGESRYTHVALIVEPELCDAGALPARGWRPERSAYGPTSGLYVRVIEGGPFPRRAADGFARLVADGTQRVPADTLVLRMQPEDLTEDQPRGRTQRMTFEPMQITVPVARIPSRGAAADDREIDRAFVRLGQLLQVYCGSLGRGLDNFQTAMSFASDQEAEPRFAETAFKAVAKVVLDLALKEATEGNPILAGIVDGLKEVLTAWHEESERARAAGGERRIAYYIENVRSGIDGLQTRLLHELDVRRDRLLEAYHQTTSGSIPHQGERGILTGDAALVRRQLQAGIAALERTLTTGWLTPRFMQHFAERFGASRTWTGSNVASGREGGTLYLAMSVYLDETGGTPRWSVKSIDSEWTLATTAPKPERLATALKDALRAQGKRVWQTNLPKMVELSVETERSFINARTQGWVRFVADPGRYEIRTHGFIEPFRRAWAVPAIRQRALDVNDLSGSNR